MVRTRRRVTAAATGLLAAGVAAIVVVAAPDARAATPTPAQQWTDVQNLVGPIRGVWTNQSYAGAISRSMPDTALLGNGDIGVTSGGGTGYKTFYVSKGNFWAGNPNPSFVALGGVTIAPVATAPAGNLALGATATASSSHPSFPPPRAVNGQWTSGYEGWVSEVGKPQTLTLDLGSAKTFNRYLIRHDGAARPAETANNTKNWTLQVSADGASWSTVDTVTNNTASTTDRTIATQSMRYLRLNITEPTQGTTADSQANPRGRIGQLELYGPGSGPTTPPAGAFREEQNILQGDVDTTMTLGGQPVTMKTWTAANDNLVVTQIRSTGTATVQLKAETFAGSADARSGFTNTAGVSGQTTWATRRTPSGTNWVSEASLATRLIGGTGAASASGATARITFDLAPGQTVRLVTAVAGGGQNPTGTAASAQSLVGAQSGGSLDTQYTTHLEWWKQYWLKSYLNVGDDVLHRYYYGALYLLGSSIRAGRMSPGLYGIWATSDSPQFSGDMHLNYNYMANFYGVYSANRTDLALPYFDLIGAYVPEARRRARQDLNRVKPDYVSRRFPSGGVPAGLLFPVGIAPYGSTADNNYHQQVGNALFAATQYVAYYDYTRDRAFLQNTAYPFLKEVAAFFQSWLEFDGQRYHLWSGPHEGTWGRNSSPDLGLLRYVLASLVSASTELNVDAALRTTWQDILNRLAPTPTTTYNGQTVFALADAGTIQGSDTRLIHPGDNTVNLEFIHPGEVLGLASSSADRQIAVNTLNAMNSWGQDNSFPKVFTQAARVGYPAASLIDQLKGQINQKLGPNLRIVDPFHGLEKTGAVEAVDNLLLQSDNGVIRVFPVWPASRNARFVNLREKDAFLVSSELTGGQVVYVDIVSQAGRPAALLSPWGTRPVTVTRAGGGTVAHTVTNGTITFPTQAGATYQIVPA
ncbi:discoidin domain-containing protein [Dactylosporangium sp. AC04546]|uniref:discoidin domain-containing protein n=1 Tax=Dactylosporangium sp. AC04546 TaxID=2862460 RepID=UPI001EDE0F8A|nr:discoidin domain-containing protein [Dactylosporangium sp. AC04546]WVK78658.1 discoidin domain-containing protein [Dactylosporangium sp. AC04546]